MAGVERKPLAVIGGYNQEIGGDDFVKVQDAAEDPTLILLPFTVSTSGDNTLVTPPSGKSIFLARMLFTTADPDGSSTPLLSLRIGGVEITRSYAINGRYASLGAVNAPLILNLSKAGSVSGTACYRVV